MTQIGIVRITTLWFERQQLEIGAVMHSKCGTWVEFSYVPSGTHLSEYCYFEIEKHLNIFTVHTERQPVEVKEVAPRHEHLKTIRITIKG